jgi:electron transfer flavoprotein beta subunit
MTLRIVVLVKQVPATESVRMDPETGTLIRAGVETIVNPLDLHAVEAALKIKESVGDALVVALSMGPPQAAMALREVIAMGCDQGILLTGAAFAGSDTWATAYALARAVHASGGAGLILCGLRATDGETGQVGPMVATLLDMPALTYVREIEWRDSGVAASRAIESGREEVECPLPALACVVREINEPRWPTLAGKRRARNAEIRSLGPGEIGADVSRLGLEGSPTRVVRLSRPSFQRTAEIVSLEETSLDDGVERLIRFLDEGGLLPWGAG